MILKNVLLTSFLFLTLLVNSQTVSHIYKINDLVNRISNSDTTYIVNFWATWCKPCVAELPAFDSLYIKTKNTKTKVILVTLDFKEDLDKKTNPFLAKHKIKSECVLLDEINGNDFINKIDPSWTGAIPATLFKQNTRKFFVEKKMHLSELATHLSDLEKK